MQGKLVCCRVLRSWSFFFQPGFFWSVTAPTPIKKVGSTIFLNFDNSIFLLGIFFAFLINVETKEKKSV